MCIRDRYDICLHCRATAADMTAERGAWRGLRYDITGIKRRLDDSSERAHPDAMNIDPIRSCCSSGHLCFAVKSRVVIIGCRLAMVQGDGEHPTSKQKLRSPTSFRNHVTRDFQHQQVSSTRIRVKLSVTYRTIAQYNNSYAPA